MSIVRTIANYADDAVRAIAANADDVARAVALNGDDAVRAATSKGIINLTGDEVSQVGNFMREYSRKPTPQLKEQILSVFTPHIERSAASLGAEGVSVQDYSQNLYLKLFESLDDACRKQNPVDEILVKLNGTTPVADDFVRMGHKSLDDLTLKEEFFVSDERLQPLSEKGVQFLNDKLRQIFGSACKVYGLTPRSYEIMSKYLNGCSLAEIGKEFHLTSERVRQLIKESAERIKHYNQKGYVSYSSGLKKGFATEIMNDLY